VHSRNQLVLTDKDDAKYKSFEPVIESIDDFKRSTVMLCNFHGILAGVQERPPTST
jgi:hypothetical protein